jgi:PleD family two-component response regulator
MARRNPLGEIESDTDRTASIFTQPRIAKPRPEEEKKQSADAELPAAAAPAPAMVAEPISTSSRQSAKASKLEKKPMTIRLTDDARDRLSELERSLQRGGLSAHQASASEIFMALLESADIAALRDRLTPKSRRRS